VRQQGGPAEDGSSLSPFRTRVRFPGFLVRVVKRVVSLHTPYATALQHSKTDTQTEQTEKKRVEELCSMPHSSLTHSLTHSLTKAHYLLSYNRN
jgi:hypothetical protein